MATRLKTIPCPQCRKSASWQDNPHRPFCSERCRLVDLGHWADENYRIPVETGTHFHDEDNLVDFEVARDRQAKGDE